MLTLNITLSSFRLSAPSPPNLPSNCQIRLSSSTHRLRAYESPIVSRPPPTSLNLPSEISFPSSFTVSWTETLPDRLALRAAALNIHVLSSTKPRFPAALCVTATPLQQLARLHVSLRNLACTTITQSLRISDTRGTNTNLILSFDAVVHCPSVIRLSMSDLLLSLSTINPLQAPLVLTVSHSLSRNKSTSLLKIVPTENTLESDPSINHHRVLSSCSVHRIQDLLLESPDLYKLAHSSLTFSLSSNSQQSYSSADTEATTSESFASSPSPSPPSPIAEVSITLHQIWAALMHPSHPFRQTFALSPSSSLSLSFCTDVSLPPGQMVGGVTTDDSITGAKPIIFGSEVIERMPSEAHLPSNWIRLVDSFGYPYFHHRVTAIEMWTVPPDESIEAAVRTEELRASQHGFDRGSRGLFMARNDSSCVWIHPQVTGSVVPRPDVLLTESRPSQSSEPTAEPEASPRTSVSLSTVELSELHPAALTRRKEDEADYTGDKSVRAPVVEIKWSNLGRECYAPREGTEGHSLTSVLGGTAMIKFGGACGSRRTRSNAVDWFDTNSMTWHEVFPSGVSPSPRTGHSAVALGTDKARLLVFGGSCTQGRLNDLHMFHVDNETWSPVSCSGPVPAARARCGMTVTSDGGTALLFGGRSIYRYLGGKYFDSLFVNAFHAERGMWEQLRPRGSGPRPAPRSGCVVEFINDRQMFVHGGYDDGDRFFDDTFVFDMASYSWQRIIPGGVGSDVGPRPEPMAREGHSSTVLNGDVVICGGNGESLFMADVHVFDTGRMRWCDPPRTVGLGPGKVSGASMGSTADGRAVFVGGEGGWHISRSTHVLEFTHRAVVGVDKMVEVARERGPDAKRCVVCLDQTVDTMFLWCGHSVCCSSCARLVKKLCPVCRKPFSRIEKPYGKVSMDIDEDGEEE